MLYRSKIAITPTMLPTQTDTKKKPSITIITILLKDLPGPVYLTLSLWNFSGSILIKEIMV